MDKKKILIQLDSDPQASVFDRVVAVDAGAEVIFTHSGVRKEQVKDLVHGAIFTRGPKDLKNTAIFIGGSNVLAAEQLLHEAISNLIPTFGLRVSLLLDPNGANTTAAAAVRVATKHMEPKGKKCLVLGGTGPVGRRVSLLLASLGADVFLASRQLNKAQEVCPEIGARTGKPPTPLQIANSIELENALKDCELLVGAGSAGVRLVEEIEMKRAHSLKVAIDLNAVPPLGLEGVEVMDKGKPRNGVICYGALGVGDLKMKTHKACVRQLFERNDLVLDALEIFEISNSV